MNNFNINKFDLRWGILCFFYWKIIWNIEYIRVKVYDKWMRENFDMVNLILWVLLYKLVWCEWLEMILSFVIKFVKYC